MRSSFPAENRFEKWRIISFYVVIALVLVYYVIRLFTLQVIQGAEYTQKALNNSTSRITLPSTRGIIYDRNGYILAKNVASYNVVITPAFLPLDTGAVQEIYRNLMAQEEENRRLEKIEQDSLVRRRQGSSS